MNPTVLELCAGGGGQALGLESAGFGSVGVVEIDAQCCETLRLNRSDWNVIETDLKTFDGSGFRGVDLVAGGVPCPPFSVAGKQLGRSDERDLFPEAIRVARETRPRAVLLENVPGFASAKFRDYREWLVGELRSLGFESFTRVLNASNFGVPQLRPRFVLVALRPEWAGFFEWPDESARRRTVGAALVDLMSSNGWKGAVPWSSRANDIAPTVVGGSKKHGGPDLGPTRAKRQWRELAVDGLGIANDPPAATFPVDGLPRLTSRAVGGSVLRALCREARTTPGRDASGQLRWLGMEKATH